MKPEIDIAMLKEYDRECARSRDRDKLDIKRSGGREEEEEKKKESQKSPKEAGQIRQEITAGTNGCAGPKGKGLKCMRPQQERANENRRAPSK
jgi:hypothetical protein